MQQKQSAMRKKEIITITIEEKSYRKQKTCHICKKEFSTNNEYKKNTIKLEILIMTLENIEVLLMLVI